MFDCYIGKNSEQIHEVILLEAGILLDTLLRFSEGSDQKRLNQVKAVMQSEELDQLFRTLTFVVKDGTHLEANAILDTINFLSEVRAVDQAYPIIFIASMRRTYNNMVSRNKRVSSAGLQQKFKLNSITQAEV